MAINLKSITSISIAQVPVGKLSMPEPQRHTPNIFKVEAL